MRGSQHNDLLAPLPASSQVALTGKAPQQLRTLTNRSGGSQVSLVGCLAGADLPSQGGISNGEQILFRVAFKPPATIGLPQQTCTYAGEEAVLQAKGRHDPYEI
jgi:chorismate synthase